MSEDLRQKRATGTVDPPELISLDRFRRCARGLEGAKLADLPQRYVVPKDVRATIKAVEGDPAAADFVITTSSVDRDGDVIEPAGWQLDNYGANPVVLWAHDYWSPPVATAEQVQQTADGISSRARFTPQDLYPFGHMIGRMVLEGFLNATSVGYIPLKWEDRLSEAAEDETGRMYQEWLGYHFLEQELLEYSIVPVPSNAEALRRAKSVGIDLSPMHEWASKALDGGSRLWLPREQVELYAKLSSPAARLVLLMSDGTKVAFKAEDAEPEPVPAPTQAEKGACPAHSTATVDEAWDSAAEEKRLWSGEEAPPPARCRAFYAWQDPDQDAATKAAWKLPHHKVSEAGTPGAANLKAVAAAFAALNGARGGTAIPDADRQGTWNHLARHYRDAELEPPELKSVAAPVESWTVDELAAMAGHLQAAGWDNPEEWLDGGGVDTVKSGPDDETGMVKQTTADDLAAQLAAIGQAVDKVAAAVVALGETMQKIYEAVTTASGGSDDSGDQADSGLAAGEASGKALVLELVEPEGLEIVGVESAEQLRSVLHDSVKAATERRLVAVTGRLPGEA